MSLPLTLTSIDRTAFTFPLLDKLLTDGLSFITTLSSTPPPNSTVKWTLLKTDPSLSTYRTHYNDTWTARVIKTSASYDVIHRAMIEERILAESEWLDGPKDTNEEMALEEFDGGILVRDVRRFLHVQAFAGREFLASVISRDVPMDEAGLRATTIVSLPIEGEMVSKSDVRGQYISVEYVREVEDGLVEIYTAVCSDAGGSIPRWVQNMAMPGQIFNDGKRFVEYIRKRSEEDGGANGIGEK